MLGLSIDLVNTFSFYFAIGVGAFIIAMFIIIALFGLSVEDTLKNSKRLTLIVVFILSATFMANRIYTSKTIDSQASSTIEVLEVNVSKINPTLLRVQAVFSTPVTAYLELIDSSTKKIIPVFSTATPKKNTVHIFTINKQGISGGTAVFIVNGYRYYYQGKPLQIIP